MDGDGERDGKVDDVGQAAVGQLASEAVDREHLPPCVLGLEAGARALRLEVEGRRADEVLAREAASRAHRLPGEQVGLARTEEAVDGVEPFLAGKRSARAAHLGERLLRVGPHAGELGDGLLDARGTDGEREVALAHEVRHALAHLVVEDAVVLLRIGRRRGVARVEEALAADEVGGDGAVHDGELHAAFRAEVVEQLAPPAEYGLLRLLARRLVADVVEGEGLAEKPFLYLRDAVLVHEVEAHGPVDVPGRAAALALLRHLVGELALLLRHAAPQGL